MTNEPIAAPMGTGPVERLFHSAIHYRDFRVLWIGLVTSFFAFNMQMVAMGYVGYQLTGSSAALGYLWLAWGGSQLVFSLVGGAVADRVPKRELMRVTQGLLGISALVTCILIAGGWIQMWMLVLAGLVQGIAFAFNAPARQAFVPAVVPRERLTQAIALNNMGNNIANAVAPAVAGLLLASVLGPAAVYGLMALLYALVQVTLMLVRQDGLAVRSGPRTSVLVDVKDGLAFMVRSPILVSLFLLAIVPILLGSSSGVLLPGYTNQQLGGEATLFGIPLSGGAMLGLLYTGIGLGAIVGSMSIAYFSAVRRRGLMQLGLGLGVAVGFIIAGTTSWFPLAFVGFMIAGGCLNAFMTSNNALLVLNSPREMYGRVFAVTMILFSVTGFTAVPFGALADAIGPGTTFQLFGVVLAAVMLLAIAFVPRIRNLTGTPAPVDV